MPLRPTLLALLTIVASLAAGCGPNCQNTCNKIYQPSECNIARAGRTPDELINDCRETCEKALDHPGDLDGYDPANSRGSSADYSIETDRQAAAWMDCVEATSCENLEQDFCPPIW